MVNLTYPLNISDVFDEYTKKHNSQVLRFADCASGEFELIQHFRFRCEKQFNPLKANPNSTR